MYNDWNLFKNMKNNYSKKMIDETLKYQKQYGFKVGKPGYETWNSEADAFKHAYMQWDLSNKMGSTVAKYLGNQHENNNGPSDERNMDLWNNSIGREVFEEMKKKGYNSPDYEGLINMNDVAARIIVDKMRNGELITEPNDTRNFENMQIERLKDSDRVFFKGELNSQNGEPVDKVLSEMYLKQAIDNNWQIPERKILDKRVNDGELIYVDNYIKPNGKKLNGYYKKYHRW